jgi:uncharacterized LabA/DUF88 family protein
VQETKRIALLIDCDNVSHTAIEGVLEELAKHGTVNVRHAHGDWHSPSLTGWADMLHPHAIRPMQQFAYTKGKNATDSAMIIDAMDILYSEKVNGFCIVSSDSDFTRLATRLREAGMQVIGIGEKKTPNPFIVACDKFIYIEILKTKSKEKVSEDEKELDNETFDKISPKEINLIVSTITDLSDDEGWAFLGDVGSLLQKKRPNFDPRNYGFQKLTPLIKSIGKFEIEQRESQKGKYKLIYVKNKEKRITRAHK